MTSGGDVIVLERSGGTVTKYTADAQQIRQIKLSSGIKLTRVYHAIETSTGTSVLISGTYRTKNNILHTAVFEVSYEGHIIKSSDLLSNFFFFEDLPSNSTSYNTTTDADGNVYVPDRHYNRVLILDSRLNLRRAIQMTNYLHFLSYSQETKQLIVAPYHNSHPGEIAKRTISIITLQ